MKNKEELDEETTIADMSFLDRKRIVPRVKLNDDNDSEPLRGSNLWAFIRGTLSATLLIGLIYAIAFGVLILLMYLYFKR